MFGCVGDDIFSGRLIDNLTKNNVDTRHIRSVSKTSCGIAMITVAQKDNTIIVIAGANQYVSREYISQEKENILQADIILLQNEIPFETVAYAADMAWKHGKTVIYNPAPFLPVPPELYEQDYLCQRQTSMRRPFFTGKINPLNRC